MNHVTHDWQGEMTIGGGAQNGQHGFTNTGPQPDSDPWQHPGASSPFAKMKESVKTGIASPQSTRLHHTCS